MPYVEQYMENYPQISRFIVIVSRLHRVPRSKGKYSTLAHSMGNTALLTFDLIWLHTITLIRYSHCRLCNLNKSTINY